jgi:hypothetical protein
MGRLKDSLVDSEVRQMHFEWVDVQPDEVDHQFQITPANQAQVIKHMRTGDKLEAVRITVLEGKETYDIIGSSCLPVPARPPLEALAGLTDWVPSRQLRKQLGKMLADDAADIQQCIAEGRLRLARWRAWCAWAWWVWYIGKAPLTLAIRFLRSSAG